MYLNRIILIIFILAFAAMPARALFGFSKEQRAQKAALEEASAAYNRGEWEPVVDIMEEFLLKGAQKEDLKKAYLLIGSSYEKQGAYDKALLKYGEAAEFFPKDIELNLALADIYYVGGLTEKAVAAYNKVLELDKNNLHALLALARAYMAEGSFWRASHYFKKYFDAGGTPSPGGGQGAADIYYDYSLSYFLANENQKALELVSRANEIQSGARISFLTAKIYKAMGDDKNAFAHINAAVAYPGAGDDIILTRALWLAYDGQTKEALSIADSFLKKDPADRPALFIKYLAYARADRAKEGRKYLETIAASDADGFIENIARTILKTPATNRISNLKI